MPIPKDINAWEHLNYFTAESLKELLKRAGFIPVGGNSQKRNKVNIPFIKRFHKNIPQKTIITSYWQKNNDYCPICRKINILCFK